MELVLRNKSEVIIEQANANNLAGNGFKDYSSVKMEETLASKAININKAYQNKVVDNTAQTFIKTTINKSKFSNDKEIRIRKIFTINTKSSVFNVTVRDIHVFYRKGRKHTFNKVFNFTTANGNIEYILASLSNKDVLKSIEKGNQLLLN